MDKKNKPQMQRLGGRNKLIKILIKTSDQHEMISPIKFQSKKKLALFCLMQFISDFLKYS